MDVTLETSHDPISWLNDDNLNMFLMVVRLETSHDPISWLNDDAE
jgi:hypothetical protein